ncbi:MAG TPA: hypothetical protein PLB18_25020, partial [Acidobacteriota bacterium]|nr:hypothetical protein [Acidobacteriota bacterium]
MSDKVLEYVSKYVVEPRILATLPADDSLMIELPEWWKEVLLAGGDDRIHRVLQAWEAYREQL